MTQWRRVFHQNLYFEVSLNTIVIPDIIPEIMPRTNLVQLEYISFTISHQFNTSPVLCYFSISQQIFGVLSGYLAGGMALVLQVCVGLCSRQLCTTPVTDAWETEGVEYHSQQPSRTFVD